MPDENEAMNAWLRGAAGRTLPPEDEQRDEEQPKRSGTANAGVRALPDEEGPDIMDALIRRARYGDDGSMPKPLPR